MPKNSGPPPAIKIAIGFKPGFKEDFESLKADNPVIGDRLKAFLEYKTCVPPKLLPHGMNDHDLGGRLKGYRECHLAGDILLIYTLKDHALTVYCLCDHSQLGGNREKALKKRLAGL